MTQGRTPIGACAWRISREGTDGTPAYGTAQGALALCGGISKFTHDYEIEKGIQIFDRDSCGTPMVNVVLDDIAKWLNGSITICREDDRIYEILGLAEAFIEPGGAIVGRGITAAAACEVAPRPNVALELWVPNYNCGELDPLVPYRRWVFTRAKFTPKGFDLSAAASLPVFDFRAFNNPNFTDGPFGDLDELAESNFAGALAVVDDTTLPVCVDPLNYSPLPPAVS